MGATMKKYLFPIVVKSSCASLGTGANTACPPWHSSIMTRVFKGCTTAPKSSAKSSASACVWGHPRVCTGTRNRFPGRYRRVQRPLASQGLATCLSSQHGGFAGTLGEVLHRLHRPSCHTLESQAHRDAPSRVWHLPRPSDPAPSSSSAEPPKRAACAFSIRPMKWMRRGPFPSFAARSMWPREPCAFTSSDVVNPGDRKVVSSAR